MNEPPSMLRTSILLLLFINMMLAGMDQMSLGSESVPISTPITMALIGQQDGGNDTRYFEYRSMWCDGYDIVNITMVKKLVAFARDHNFNCLSPLINGNYYGVYYNSSYLPKHRDVQWSFDPLMELIKEAHKYGIQVHPWFHTLYDYLATSRNPSWRVVSSSGSPASGWMNPALPQVRNYLVNVTTEIIRNYPLDGIKLDTARYPGSTYSYDSYTLSKFQGSGMSSFSDFRRLQVTECVGSIYDAIMNIRPYIWVSADIYMYYQSWYDGVFQDSREWAKRGDIDFVTTMSYTTSKSSFEYYNKDIITKSEGVPVVCGPYVFVPGNTAHGSVPNETVGIDLLLNQTETAKRLGSLGTCMFSYKFLNQCHSYVDALLKGPYSKRSICPLKEQKIPVRTSRWEFDNDHDREGWRVVEMGHQYPLDGFWSISNVSNPSLMSPLLNITSQGTNVIEISMISESRGGTLEVYWSCNGTVFQGADMVKVPIVEDGEWHLYSIHLDISPRWIGNVQYLRIVPVLAERTNITLDLIRLYWMPECIEDWAYLGPFISGSDEGLVDRDFIGDEHRSSPRLGTVESGRVWTSFGMDRDLIDLRFVLGGLTYSVAYAHIYVLTEEMGEYELRVGTSDGSKVFLNGQEVLMNSLPRRVSPDQNVTMVTLSKGLNRLLVKLAVYENELSFFARFTRPGNLTADGLTYALELPLPEPPRPSVGFEYWTPDPIVSVEWDGPPMEVPISHYVWSVDSGPLNVSTSRSVLINIGSPGPHYFEVGSVDIYGFSSEMVRLDLGFDPERSEVSLPTSISSLVRTGKIGWEWSVERVPLSGIKGFYVRAFYITQTGERGTVFEGERFTDGPFFTLTTGLVDTYSYELEVRAESRNGLSSNTVTSLPVTVDLLPPLPPKGVSLELIDGANRTYELGWEPSWDNLMGGVILYEVFKVGSKGDVLVGSTTYCTYNVTRTIGSQDGFKVRALDISGYASPMTGTVLCDNLPPHATIVVSSGNNEGHPIRLSGQSSYDQDGIIKDHLWKLDGAVICNSPELAITLEHGWYEFELYVVDDLGAMSHLTLSLIVTATSGPYINGSFRTFLDTSSELIVRLPDLNSTEYHNETFLDPPVDDGPLIEGARVLDMLVMILLVGIPSIILFCIILVSLQGLVSGKTFEISVPEDLGQDEWSYVQPVPSMRSSIPASRTLVPPRMNVPVLAPGLAKNVTMAPLNLSKPPVPPIGPSEGPEIVWDEEIDELEELEGLEEFDVWEEE